MADQVGSKMANLGDIMTRVGLPVPAGFAITSLAYSRFMQDTGLQDEVNRLIQAVGADDHATLLPLCSQIQQMILAAEVPADVAQAIRDAYAALECKTIPRVRVSLRSSALGERAGPILRGAVPQRPGRDSRGAHHHLQRDRGQQVQPTVTYRLAKGIPDEDVAMCVGCMAMISARSGGVAYSRNPLAIRDDEVFVHSAWGLAKTVVDPGPWPPTCS